MEQQDKRSKDQLQKKSTQLNTYAKYSSIAIQMFAIIGIGSIVGVKLDDHFVNDNNLYAIIFSLSSVILAIFFVIRRIIAGSKDN